MLIKDLSLKELHTKKMWSTMARNIKFNLNVENIIHYTARKSGALKKRVYNVKQTRANKSFQGNLKYLTVFTLFMRITAQPRISAHLE